jgi:hypothetical protein
MNEARPYASLSSGLLARKGTAKPAMRPQGFGTLEDLGWNDMGDAEPGKPAPAEHVPSSIAALTPAPKIQRTHPGETPFGAEPEDFGAFVEGEPVDEAAQAEAFPAAQEADDFQEADAGEEAEIAEAGEPEAAEQPVFAANLEPILPETPVEEPVAEAVPAAPSVAAQQRAILERFDGEEELEAAPARALARAEVVPLPPRQTAADPRKAAFTLRLDSARHLRLRLACAVSGRSAQQIVALALDEALAGIPEIEALASQVPAKPGRAGKVKSR